MTDIKHEEQANIIRLKELVDELTVRDEQIFREHGIFEQIVRLVLDGIWIIDEKYETVFINDQMCAMLGFTQAEMIGEQLIDYLQRDIDVQKIKKSIGKKKYAVKEQHIFQLKCKDNSFTSATIITAPLFGLNRKYRGSIVYVKEITNDEVLNYYKQVFFDVSLDALLVTDVHGIIQDANPQYYTMLEYSKKEVVGQHFSNFITKEDKDKSTDAFDELIIGNDLLIFENNLLTKKGDKVPVTWRARPVLENGLIFATGRRIII